MASFTSRLAGWAAGRLKGEKARKKTMEFVDKTGVGKLLSLAGDAAILGGAGKLAGMGAAKLGFGKGAGAIGGSTGGAPPRLDAAGRVIDSAKEYQQVAPGLPGHLDKMMLKASKDIDSEGVARRITSALGSGSMTPNLPGMEQFGGAVRQSPGFRGISDMVKQGATDYIGRNPTMMERVGGAVRGIPSAARSAGAALMKRPEIASAGLTALSQSRQAAANRRIQEQQLAQNQSQFEQEFGLRKGEQEREVERQRRIAETLAPLFQRISGGQG